VGPQEERGGGSGLSPSLLENEKGRKKNWPHSSEEVEQVLSVSYLQEGKRSPLKKEADPPF